MTLQTTSPLLIAPKTCKEINVSACSWSFLETSGAYKFSFLHNMKFHIQQLTLHRSVYILAGGLCLDTPLTMIRFLYVIGMSLEEPF